MLALLAIALAHASPSPSPAATPAPTGVSVGLALQPSVGLTDAELAVAQKKLTAELAALGLVVVNAEPVDPGCVPDPGCVEAARAALVHAPPALLVVEMVRVGPVTQLTATGGSGDKLATGTHGIDEAQMQKGPLLPDNVRSWAKSLASAVQKAPLTPPPDDGQSKKTTSFAFTPIESGALFAGGVGVIALVASGILIGTSEPVLEDKQSSGAQKEQAATFGFVGIGSGAIGVAALAGAAVLFFVIGAPPPAATTPSPSPSPSPAATH